MASIFESTRNTRFLPGNTKYIRSDIPENLKKEEIDWLLKNDVRTIIDLRTIEEIEKKPCSLEKIEDFNYRIIPVTGGNTVPETPRFVSASYLKMVDASMLNTIDVIMSAKTRMLYFCNAGKDRTGVVSALLLMKQHVLYRVC